MQKILSVIVPSYNQADFIKDNLEILSKLSDNIDTHVIDNLSSDGTDAVIRKFTDIYADSIFEKDSGQTNAINKGVKISRQKWISFQNSDDYYDKIGLMKVIEFLKTSDSKNFDIVIAGTNFVDKEGNVIKANTVKVVPLWTQAKRNHLNNQSIFFRRELYEKIGGFDENLKFCMDYDFFTKALAETSKIKYLNITVGYQRLHENTKTVKLKPIHDEEFTKIRNKLFKKRQIFLYSLLYPIYKIYRITNTVINSFR